MTYTPGKKVGSVTGLTRRRGLERGIGGYREVRQGPLQVGNPHWPASGTEYCRSSDHPGDQGLSRRHGAP